MAWGANNELVVVPAIFHFSLRPSFSCMLRYQQRLESQT